MEYLGTVTLPALSSDPSVNQREFPSVKSLTYCLTDVERRMVLQPDFDHRWTENRTRETARKMAPTAAQTSVARGDMKERKPGFCFIGFLIIILMPSSMNGALKSTTRSLALVMVMAPRATSVSWAALVCFWNILLRNDDSCKFSRSRVGGGDSKQIIAHDMTTPPSSTVYIQSLLCNHNPLQEHTCINLSEKFVKSRLTYPTDQLADDTVPSAGDVRIFVTVSVILDFT